MERSGIEKSKSASEGEGTEGSVVGGVKAERSKAGSKLKPVSMLKSEGSSGCSVAAAAMSTSIQKLYLDHKGCMPRKKVIKSISEGVPSYQGANLKRLVQQIECCQIAQSRFTVCVLPTIHTFMPGEAAIASYALASLLAPQ